MNEILFNTLREYRLNQLSAKEKAAFEERLATDPIFAKEAAEYAAILEAIQQKGDQMLDAQLTEYAEKLLETETTPVTLYTSNARKMTARRRFLYAAAAVFLLLVAALLFFPPSKLTTEEIYASNFSEKSLSRASRDINKEPWLADYERGDFSKVIKDLNDSLANSSFEKRTAAYLYIGVSKLAQGHPAEALTSLEQISRSSYDYEEAQWFRAMALLNMGKKKEAKTIIDDIVQQSGHLYHEQAEKVQQELEKK